MIVVSCEVGFIFVFPLEDDDMIQGELGEVKKELSSNEDALVHLKKVNLYIFFMHVKFQVPFLFICDDYGL